jgi:hypothetical protein
MKRLLLLLSIGLIVLLTACSGVLGAIIGERSVDNLFGLNDRVVEFALPTTSGLAPAQIPYELTLPVTASFETPVNDVGELNLPLGVAPQSASEELGISPILEFSAASSEETFPTSLGIAEPSLELTFTDDSGTPSVQKSVAATPGQTFTFNRVSPCVVSDGRTVCQYQATVEEVFFFTLEFEGEEFGTLFNEILQGGAETNTVAATFNADLSADLPDVLSLPTDGNLKVVLKTRNGKVRFG